MDDELPPRNPGSILPGQACAEKSTGCSFRGLDRRAFIAGAKCRRGHSPLSLVAVSSIIDTAGGKES